MEVILFRTFSHVIIMKWKVDPHTEGGAAILIKESCIKAKGLRLSKKLDWYGLLLHSYNTDLRMVAAVFASKLLLLFLGQRKKKKIFTSSILKFLFTQSVKKMSEKKLLFLRKFSEIHSLNIHREHKIRWKTFLSEISRIRIPPPPPRKKRKKL